jgi:hypothetical protein
VHTQLITAGVAIFYVLSGMYGSPAELGMGNCLLIVLQLVMTGMSVILWDELLQKVHTFGGACSFHVCNFYNTRATGLVAASACSLLARYVRLWFGGR